MKKTGLKYPVVALYSDTTGEATYSNGVVMGKAMSAAIAWTKNNVKLIADDEVDEIDQSISGGTITFGINELTFEIQSLILGHQIDGSGHLTVSALDIAPYVGFGVYGEVYRDHARKYRAVWLQKVQFGEPNDDTNTKGETIAFQTPTITGEIMRDASSKLEDQGIFDTEAEAKAWLNAKAGITPICKTPTASVVSGTYATAQSVTLTAGAGEAIHYTTNGLTPTATSPLYSTAIAVADDMAIRAIAIKDGSSNSEIAEFEYIITA